MATYSTGSQIPITDVGESTPTSGGALVCRTDKTGCCRSDNRRGEWRFPNGSLVRINDSGDGFYRTRGDMVVQLHRRNGAMGAMRSIGQYCCEVASLANESARICINLSKI